MKALATSAAAASTASIAPPAPYFAMAIEREAQERQQYQLW